jgi:hypothetical protein
VRRCFGRDVWLIGLIRVWAMTAVGKTWEQTDSENDKAQRGSETDGRCIVPLARGAGWQMSFYYR